MKTNRDWRSAMAPLYRSPLVVVWLLIAQPVIAQPLITRALSAADPLATVEAREAWTTSRVTGSPEPPWPYVSERVFPSLTFDLCVDITTAPGSDRLFVVEQNGKIFSFPNRPDVTRADLVIDFTKAIPGVEQVYALAFHPDFERNRYCYVCYIRKAELPEGTHVARFEMSNDDPPTIDPATELTLLTWLSGGHNGCCLKFGPDRCLYISTGDGVGPNPPDTLRTGQDVSDLLSSILRIDVDHADNGRNYGIPADNPFVGLDGARGEVWAYGLRNPWRMSFDGRTGDLWVGDVGWEVWEFLYRVERGGNYGWSVMEGRQPTNLQWPRGPTPILPPTIDHPHSESSSITDGLTYYGQRLPELRGNHVYGDYDTGKLWAFRFEEGKVVSHRALADTTLRIVGFGEDPQGEFLILDHTSGTIHRLIPNPRRDSPTAFPRRLSETGLFSSVADHGPAPGVRPYAINAESWADYASAERWVGLPNTSSIQTTPKEGARWVFPSDSVLMKTLSLEMVRGQPDSRRRMETQILHFDGEEWQTYTYRWNDEQSDGTLVEATGDERIVEVIDPDAPGGTRRQTWRFSGRAECQRCHNKWSGPPLAFDLPQLNVPRDSEANNPSQLDLFAKLQLLDKPISEKDRTALVRPHDQNADIDRRARSYLHANCAHCHRMHAGSAVLSKMSFEIPLAETDMVGVPPAQGAFGIFGAEVIAAGDPFRSVLCYRMSKLGGGRMPHIGSTEVDTVGTRLIRDWVKQLPAIHSADTTSQQRVAGLRANATADLAAVRAASDSDARMAGIERLLASTSGAMLLASAMNEGQLTDTVRELAVQRAARHEDVSVRDLFECYVPYEQRTQRLGSVVHPERILKLRGDAARGRRLFFDTPGVQCKTCHRIQQAGLDVGPDLTEIGKKYDRGRLLETILEPSKLIDAKYVTYLAELEDGRVLTGLLVSKDERMVVLKTAQNAEMSIPSTEVVRLTAQSQSLMPELLLRDMTAEQVADLLEFLGSLR